MLEGNSKLAFEFCDAPGKQTAPGLRKEGEKGLLYVKDIVK